MARKPRRQATDVAVPSGGIYGPSIRATRTNRTGMYAVDPNAPNVSHLRYELAHVLPIYAQIRDCLLGEVAMKRHDIAQTPVPLFGMVEFAQSNLYNGGGLYYVERYLPRPNAADLSLDNRERYRQYVERAVFHGYAAHTLETLVGAVFLRAPVIVLPATLEAFAGDISGNGVSLIQFAKQTCSQTTAYGRCGILIDFPAAHGVLTLADKQLGNYRATLTLYTPWAVINWRSVWVNGIAKLSLVVIAEPGLVQDDGFKETTQEQYRVLRLIDGVYSCEIWRRDTMDGNTVGDIVIHQSYTPTDDAGKTFDYIPFTFVGPADNSASVDKPPMADIASINVAHYRNSADFEESLYITGQATPVITGLTQEWATEVLRGVVALGARSAIMLPVGGKAELLQAKDNSLAQAGMLEKQSQMRALGARLIEEKRVQKTATEAGIDEASSQSVLASIAANVSQAMLWALQQMARFEGVEYTNDTLKFELNTELDLIKPSPESRKQWLTEWEAGGISWTEYRHNLRRGGVAIQEDDVAKAEIAASPAPNSALVLASVVKAATNDKTAP